MCNGSGFDRFAQATGASYDELATWEGFYDAAGQFYDWSGKPFCALDYPLRAVELCALERGSEDFYTEDGWYDTDNAVFKESCPRPGAGTYRGVRPLFQHAGDDRRGALRPRFLGGDPVL